MTLVFGIIFCETIVLFGAIRHFEWPLGDCVVKHRFDRDRPWWHVFHMSMTPRLAKRLHHWCYGFQYFIATCDIPNGNTIQRQLKNPTPSPNLEPPRMRLPLIKLKTLPGEKKHPVMIGLFFDVVGLSALQGLQLMKSLEDKFSTQSRNPDHFAMFFWGEFQVVRCCWCCFLGKELELRWQLVSGGVIWLIDIFSLGLCSAMSLNLFPPESLSSIFINHWSSIQHWWSQAGMDDTGWNLMARQSWWFLKSWMLGNWQIIIDVSEYLCFTVLQCHVYLHRCDMNFIYRYVRIYKNEYRLHTSIRTYMYMKHVI